MEISQIAVSRLAIKPSRVYKCDLYLQVQQDLLQEAAAAADGQRRLKGPQLGRSLPGDLSY